MTTIEAIYEHGTLRLLEPLDEELAEGARVGVIVIANGDEGPDSGEPQKKDQRTPAEILAEIAALPLEGDPGKFSGRDHDQILYGDAYREYGA